MYRFPKKIFPTNLNNYLLCPFKWKCSNDPDLKPLFVHSIASFTGKAVHLALYKILDISQTPIHDRMSRDVVSTKFDEAWSGVDKNKGDFFTDEDKEELFGSKEQETAHKTQTKTKLFLYISNLQNYASVIPIMLEDWFDCNIGEFFIGSRIDRLDAGEGEKLNTKVRVIDYKTGKLPYENSLDDIIKKDCQMVFNAVILAKRYPYVSEIEGYLDYISHCSSYAAIWTRSRIAQMETRLLAMLRKIKDTKDFPPQKNPLCDWCAFQKTECSLFKENVKE